MEVIYDKRMYNINKLSWIIFGLICVPLVFIIRIFDVPYFVSYFVCISIIAFCIISDKYRRIIKFLRNYEEYIMISHKVVTLSFLKEKKVLEVVYRDKDGDTFIDCFNIKKIVPKRGILKDELHIALSGKFTLYTLIKE